MIVPEVRWVHSSSQPFEIKGKNIEEGETFKYVEDSFVVEIWLK